MLCVFSQRHPRHPPGLPPSFMIDLDLAVAWHKTFLHHLDRELAGEEQSSAELLPPFDASRCELGRWLDGAGQAYRPLTHFAAVQQQHRLFHDRVCATLQKLRQGDRNGAVALRTAVVQTASNALVHAIEALRQEYAALSPEACAMFERLSAQDTSSPLHWDEAFALGLPAIDREHRELTALANRLHEHPEATCRDEVVVDILTALGKFLVVHFRNEEAIMRQLGMPEDMVDEHVRAHNRILDQYADLNIAAAGGDAYRAADIFVHVMEWVGRHMVDYDLRIKAYLPACG
jgi:hemerythrin-like metal-binding protein